MSTKAIATIVFISFMLILVGGLYYFRPSLFNAAQSEDSVETPAEEPESKIAAKPESEMKVDRIQIIEEALSEIKKDQDNQDSLITDLSEKMNDLATVSASLANKTILDTKQSQGGVFTTASTAYTPMSTFVNITCTQACILWINFYSSSKNDSSNNVNTYGIFLNGLDKGIYSQGNIPNANGTVPIALNASLPVSSGSYTVEIKAKTSGGTLQSDVSFLQVLAIED